MTPVVSVIIPAWNAALYIDEALASVRAQTLSEWEALIIDDASGDDTAERAAAAAAGDSRFRLIRQDRNQGPSAARNRGIDEARGRYLALLDADDAYAPTRLAQMVALAERHGSEMASDNLWLLPEGEPSAARAMIPLAVLDGERLLTLSEFIARNVADPAYPDLNFGFMKPIFLREFVAAHSIRYDERVRFAEDFALYVDCFGAGARWWISSAPTYTYRVRSGSLTQIQTVHDLSLLRARLSGLIEQANAVGDRTLLEGLSRQARVVDRCYHYRAFTDHIKARRFGGAITELSGSRRAMFLILQETARQLPTIAKKIARGGY